MTNEEAKTWSRTQLEKSEASKEQIQECMDLYDVFFAIKDPVKLSEYLLHPNPYVAQMALSRAQHLSR